MSILKEYSSKLFANVKAVVTKLEGYWGMFIMASFAGVTLFGLSQIQTYVAYIIAGNLLFIIRRLFKKRKRGK